VTSIETRTDRGLGEPAALAVTEPAPDGEAFPAGFLWGAATAAYQVEGGVAEGGRGASIWDTFSHTPGLVTGGDTGDVAADHFHRWREDVALMARLGLQSYRFSVAWPRVQPDGSGDPNQEGLDFYRRLVDELRSYDIEPWITLYHWDLPQPLQDAGGWPARDTAARFAAYAEIVHRALGDRVSYWTTMNEPWCSAFLGYGSGAHAPALSDPRSAIRASHHLLLGHGLAVQAIRSAAPAAEIGITLNLYAVTSATRSAPDADAARRIDGLQNRWFLDPLLEGSYPQDVLADLGDLVDHDLVRPDDLRVIGQPLDLLGINYYTRHTVRAGAELSSGPSAFPGSEQVEFVHGDAPVTDMGWDVDPAGLVEVLGRVHGQAGSLPLYVTENGAAFPDEVTADGAVHDVERTAYLRSHLRACHRAIESGVPLRGYFVWSLMDNFEWAYGYSKRFGIVHVDYSTQRRTRKDSALFYAAVLRDGRLPSG
jgi:beta-glucosidase